MIGRTITQGTAQANGGAGGSPLGGGANAGVAGANATPLVVTQA
jgi:hypothetical protein